MADKEETTEPEYDSELKKEYELNQENKKYNLEIELTSNTIIFELKIISEISYYIYSRKYTYNDIIKDLNLSVNIYDDLSKVFEYIEIDEYQIIEENKNKKIKINNKGTILLYEKKNPDIQKILINELHITKTEINKQNEKINELFKINREKDKKIKYLESKCNNIKKELDILINIYKNKKEINLIYESENEEIQNIFGKSFVETNKNNIKLSINGEKTDLIDKYKLKKGYNNIKLKIINKITNISNMFCECKTLKNINDLKYLNTEDCNDFSNTFKGCMSLSDIKSLEKWNVSKGNNFRCMFSECPLLCDIRQLEKWDVSNGNNFLGMFSGCTSLSDIKPLEKWNVSEGNNFSFMFCGCSKLSDVTPLENWNIKKGNNFNFMFSKCNSLLNKKSLEKWNISKEKYKTIS